MDERITTLVKSHYPNAINENEFGETYLEKIGANDIDISKLLYATSVCSDEVNIDSFKNKAIGPFTKGGLAGFPFTGHTGMVAFAHHIPKGGSAVVFYGAHIGMTEDGKLGKLKRHGQEHYSTSCGALMVALSRMKDDNYTPNPDLMDYQQVALEKMLEPYKDQILGSSNPIKEITDVAFILINAMMHRLLKDAKSEFAVERVVFIGGIIINTSHGLDDYIDVKNFEVINLSEF